MITEELLYSSVGLPPNPVVPHLKQKVTNFKQGMPVISSLRNTALKERHWNEIQAIIGTKVVSDKSFTLGNLLQLKVGFVQLLTEPSDILSQQIWKFPHVFFIRNILSVFSLGGSFISL